MIAIAVGNAAHGDPLVAPARDGSDAMQVTIGHIAFVMDRKTAADMADKILRLEQAMVDADYEQAKKTEATPSGK